MKWPGKFERKDNKGGIHKLHLQAMGRGLAKCQRYYLLKPMQYLLKFNFSTKGGQLKNPQNTVNVLPLKTKQ